MSALSLVNAGITAGAMMLFLAAPSVAAPITIDPAFSVAAEIAQEEAATKHLCLRSDEVTKTLEAEFATTAEARAEGLMMRESLEADASMLFVYEYTASRSFWMYRTLIPLDIAYIDANGEILDIQQMQPCRSYWSNRCPSYPAAAPFLYALEVNLGKFAEWGIEVGDTVLNADCETHLEDKQPWR